MKKVKSIVIILILCTTVTFAESEKTVKSKIKNVTVFLNSAQIYRSGYINIGTGTTKLVFEGISEFIQPNSIQATGRGNFIILDVQHNIRYTEASRGSTEEVPVKFTRQIKAIEDSLPYLNFDIERLTNKIDILTREKNMILNNVTMQGGGRSDSLPILKEALLIFNTNLNAINDNLIKIKIAEHKLKLKRKEMQSRLNDLKSYVQKVKKPGKYEPAKAVYQVIVSVFAKSPTTGSVSLNYIVSNAGWEPAYDIRAKGTDKPIQITYKANVFQNTGIDWSGVKLKLSTNNPNKRNVKPTLSIWYLNYFVRRLINKKDASYGRSNIGAQFEAVSKNKSVMEDILPDASLASSFTQKLETMISAEFVINLPYSIYSNGKKHLIAIQDGNIPAKFVHYIVPKVDKEAYLMAKITDWEELNLLPAIANIYFESTYVGQTNIDPEILEDTLEFAFGIDQSIVTTREKIKDLEKDNIVGNKREKTFTVEITVRNGKNSLVNVIIEDQIPISANEDIEITVVNIGNAEYNDKTGKLVWTLKLKPKGKKIIKFTYTVKYDKTQKLSS